MKKYIVLFLGILIATSSYSQEAEVVNTLRPSALGISEKQTALIFNKLKHYPNQTQLAIAIIQNGIPHFVGAIKHKDSVLPCNNQQHIFEIGSITKVFTATLLSNLVLEKKVSLEDPIQDYFDFDLKTDQIITLKQLANHTSGLPRIATNHTATIQDITNPFKDFHEKELNIYLKFLVSLEFKPGTQHLYSNLGAGILGFLLSKKTNRSYESLLQSYIFDKYKMSNSTSQQSRVKGTLISGIDDKGKKIPNWDFDLLAGAGSILSSTEDLSKFALAQFDPKNKELLFTQQPTFVIHSKRKQGLGWTLLKTAQNELISHNGKTGGYTSSIVLDVDNKNGIIILSNLSGRYDQEYSINNISFSLMQSLYEN